MLVKVTRPYGGQEGRRVRPGTVFSVDQDVEGLITITTARWRQLKQMNLAVEIAAGEAGAPAAPGAKPAPNPRSRPAPTPANKVEPDSRPPASPPARTRARRRAQEDSPKEPRPLHRRGGGPAGSPEPAASSSQEDRQVGSLTLKQRGTRRASAGSPSTTPASPPTSPASTESPPASAPGPTPSTPATPDGGTDSDPSGDSAAFA